MPSSSSEQLDGAKSLLAEEEGIEVSEEDVEMETASEIASQRQLLDKQFQEANLVHSEYLRRSFEYCRRVVPSFLIIFRCSSR